MSSDPASAGVSAERAQEPSGRHTTGPRRPSAERALADLLAAVAPGDPAAAAAAARRSARLAKPPGSLGALEALGARLAAAAGRCPPPVPQRPAVLVAAADHGVHAQGVTPWPQSLTAQMVATMCAGGAAVDVLADSVGAEVAVVDVGVATDVPAHPRLRRARVRPGTADLSQGPAMGRDEAVAALLAGARVATGLVDAGMDLLVPGDMGIANTTAGACLVAAFSGRPAAAVTGPGAAGAAAAPPAKVAVVSAALERHRPERRDPLGVLAALGGLEHAALAGAILAAAGRRVPIVLDGLASVAAALVAAALRPAVRDHLIAGHRSAEPGAAVALEHLGIPPLLDLGLRLGEGTGGLLAVPLVVAAARVLGEMATLDDLAAEAGP